MNVYDKIPNFDIKKKESKMFKLECLKAPSHQIIFSAEIIKITSFPRGENVKRYQHPTASVVCKI